jgi:hypothetical protein
MVPPAGGLEAVSAGPRGLAADFPAAEAATTRSLITPKGIRKRLAG